MYEITLAKKRVKVSSLKYSIVDVVDGRKDTLSIGWVQTGLANRKQLATFPQPASREIMQLLQQSGIIHDEGPKVILRIEYLSVSEQTRLTTENARAQVGLDLFRIEGDQAWFVGREYATVEDRGGDVTHKHAGNIARAIGEILTAFNAYDLSASSEDDTFYPITEIADFRDTSYVEPTAPIYTATRYPDGLYTSFNEFRNNTPSIVDGYEVNGDNQVRVRWVDRKGRKRRIRESVYALAHNNKLYIFFDNNFYPIERRNHGFYFQGPDVQDPGAVIAGGWLGGALGAAIMGAASTSNLIYRIDLKNGSVRAVGVR
jgi:hypothetical protein